LCETSCSSAAFPFTYLLEQFFKSLLFSRIGLELFAQTQTGVKKKTDAAAILSGEVTMTPVITFGTGNLLSLERQPQQNPQLLVKAYLEKSRNALKSMEIKVQASLVEWAVSASYYAK
jgi:hypothetical protein